MKRALIYVIVIVVAGAFVSSVVALPYFESLNPGSRLSNSLSVTTNAPPSVNVTLTADWTTHSASSSGNNFRYYVLEVFLTVENNRSVEIPSQFSLYSTFKIVPFDNVAGTPWSYSKTVVQGNQTYPQPLNPGQKDQEVYQVFIFPNYANKVEFSSVLKESNAYLNSSIGSYSSITWNSYSIVPKSAGTFYFQLINGSDMKQPVNMYGTYYNITDTMVI